MTLRGEMISLKMSDGATERIYRAKPQESVAAGWS
jgi:hypothetical protein